MTAVEPISTGPLTRREILIVFVGLMTALFLSALDTNIVGVALPTIVGDLGGLQQIAWVGTAYLLTSTAATPLFGKFSDLYGRRRLFQVAIMVFVVGSLLCAISQTMTQLVLSRGVQGVGGGGIFAMAFAVIGDVVPARERGRYVGFFTSVFAFASVAGPLLGGFFVDNIGWRWIFLINVPLGAIAMVVTSAALRLPFRRQPHKIDVLGATLLVAAVVSFILMISWGGEGTYGWSSAPVVGMGAATVLLTIGFVLWEGHAPEPILPLRLFDNGIFRVIAGLMLLMGGIMFGATQFLPLFLQAVDGVSATQSGLLMVPLMAGVTISSIGSGRLTAITGRYKRWPVIGMGLATVGTAMLATLSPDVSRIVISTGMLLLGLGLGMTMPTSTLAVQNSVEFRDMGVATSMVTFFRSLGGCIGLAIYGAIFNAKIMASGVDETLLQSPDNIKLLPLAERTEVIDVLSDAVSAIFVVAVPIVFLGWILTLFLKEIPLRETTALSDAQPSEPASVAGVASGANGTVDGAAGGPADAAVDVPPAGAILH
jgi:EmrB/QacA subfamily drug resistance transporter